MTGPDHRRPAHPIAPPQGSSPCYQGERVALFVPCYVDQLYPQVAMATELLFGTLGVPLAYPPAQTCCGQPAFNSGYWREARQVVRHFCEVFAPYRWIVTPSGSCAAMCRVFFAHLDVDERMLSVGRRVFELTEFLVDVLGVTDTGGTYPHAVALHLGCHTQRELGVVAQPLTLLENLRGVQVCPLPDLQECCGFGGTFSVKMPRLSLAMGHSKLQSAFQTGAEVLASTDVSCLMHLEGIMRRMRPARTIQMKHIAELLVAGLEQGTGVSTTATI